MLPETTKQRIEHDAQHRYSKHKEGLYKDNCVACYIAGATAEAEMSAAWKAEATLLINKIHDWAEGDKTLPLGHSVFDEAVKRLKAYDELQEKAQRLADALLSAKAYLSGLSAGGGHMFTSIPPIITEIDNALQQWRGEKK